MPFRKDIINFLLFNSVFTSLHKQFWIGCSRCCKRRILASLHLHADVGSLLKLFLCFFVIFFQLLMCQLFLHFASNHLLFCSFAIHSGFSICFPLLSVVSSLARLWSIICRRRLTMIRILNILRRKFTSI